VEIFLRDDKGDEGAYDVGCSEGCERDAVLSKHNLTGVDLRRGRRARKRDMQRAGAQPATVAAPESPGTVASQPPPDSQVAPAASPQGHGDPDLALRQATAAAVERQRGEAQEVRDAASRLTARGFKVVNYPRYRKFPTDEGWPDLRLAEPDLDARFPTAHACNIGILCGEPSGGLVDVDLDTPEAVAVGEDLLPETGMVHGRFHNPRSHWWYRTDRPPDKASTGFEDVDGKKLLELRSTGGQTMVPPSRHPSLERLRWDPDGEPAFVPFEELLTALNKVAAAAILARHWPKEGSRQDAALALSGGLLDLGW
jgi:hypothetical protein